MKSTKNTRHLARLSLVNWRSHLNTVLEFVPGCNIITGIEDSGKSNLLRAVEWIRSNRPSGESFNHGKDPKAIVVAEVEFADGTVINRTKAKDANTYSFTTGTGEGSFSKVGTLVPDAITDLLQLEDVNLQGQFDQPYLVWLTSGELANVFNKLSGMQKFEEWQTAVSNGIKAANTAIRKGAADIDKYTEELHKYAELAEVEALVAEIDTIDRKLPSINKEFEYLRQINEGIKHLQSQIKLLSRAEEASEQVFVLIAASRLCTDQLVSLEQEHAVLNALQQQIELISCAEVELAKAISEFVLALKKNGICDRCYGVIDSSAIMRIKEKLEHGHD